MNHLRFIPFVFVCVSCDRGSNSDSANTGITLAAHVIDSEGLPVANAQVLMGGWAEERWVKSNEDGFASVPVVDSGWTEQYLLAGKEGWTSAGVRLDFDNLPDVAEITLRPLPEIDNPDYHFQPGGDGSSPNTSECGHCHWTIGDDWAGSAHAASASSERAWDLYTGTALSVSGDDCDTLAGWVSEGGVPGAPAETAEHCYTGEGVLPWLHDECGGSEQPACDHPDERPNLEAFGSCADCHAPAIDAGIPGHLDLAQASGVGFEGVTCDFCHKVQSVEPGTRPGLDGAIHLLRPSEDTFLPGQEYSPIIFGPYPDVIVPIMNGSYVPQFRESEWCSACHEYAQPALHPEQDLDSARWPDGIPVFETWSEYRESSFVGLLTCQECHMPALYEESSTYDITPQGLEPSVDQGWMRPDGEVRHHGFSRDGMSAPGLSIDVDEMDGEWVVSVMVKNSAAGHAVPTGEPMKQLILLIRAFDEVGNEILPIGGQAIPDVGGFQTAAVLGEDAQIDGQNLTIDNWDDELEGEFGVRFVRPTGSWIDYDGPGTSYFSSGTLTPEQKGLEREEFLGEVSLLVSSGTLTLAEAPPDTKDGDRIYIVKAGSDLAGSPGWLYAKTLTDSEGQRAVPHYRAVDVASDNRIAPGSTGYSEHRFARHDGMLTFEVSLMRREQPAAISDQYGWASTDTVIATLSEEFGP